MTTTINSTLVADTARKLASVPAFAVGDEQAKRINGKVVGVIVSVNVSHKNREREGDAAIPIYEVPLMRRLYEREGGTLILRPNWVPSTPRHRFLTDALFDDRNKDEQDSTGELPRLRKTYLIKSSQTKEDLMAEVYGPTKAEQARNLQAGMRSIYDAWRKLYAQKVEEVRAEHPDLENEVLSLFPPDEGVTQRVFDATVEALMLELTGQVITVNELEKLVDLVDPRAQGLDDYQLDGIDLNTRSRATLIGEKDPGDKVLRAPKTHTPGKDAQLDAPYEEAAAEDAALSDGLPTEINAGENLLDVDDLTVSEQIQRALEPKYGDTAAMSISMLALEPAGITDEVLDNVPELKKDKRKYKAIQRIVAGFLQKK